MNATKTYSAMADLIGTYISHHLPGSMCPDDAGAIGVLAALVNIQHGTHVKANWQDIRNLSEDMLQMYIDREPELFVGEFGIPEHTDHGHGHEIGPASQNLQACKNEPVRAPNSALNRGEAMAASSTANRLKGTTLVKFSAEDQLLIDNAILTPTQLLYREFIRLMQLIGVMTA